MVEGSVSSSEHRVKSFWQSQQWLCLTCFIQMIKGDYLKPN